MSLTHFSKELLRQKAIELLDLADPKNNKDYFFIEHKSTEDYLVYNHRNTSRTFSTIVYNREVMINKIINELFKHLYDYTKTNKCWMYVEGWLKDNLYSEEYKECYKGKEYLWYEHDASVLLLRVCDFLTFSKKQLKRINKQ